MFTAVRRCIARVRAWARRQRAGTPDTWRSSHEGLLETVRVTEGDRGEDRRRPDAIVVPTSRPDPHLRPGIQLALELARDCEVPAVVVCSLGAAGEAATENLRKLAESVGGVDVVVLGLAPEAGRGTRFRVDGLSMSRAYRRVRGVEGRNTPGPGLNDVGRKRNLALLLARTAGWRHLLFLDDDVFANEQPRRSTARRVPTLDRATLSAAVRAVESGTHDAVGWLQRGFDDNSVLHRMRSDLGEHQAQFLSGGALLVRIDADTPFFPLIYNEDWLFLFGYGVRAGRAPRLGVAGEVGQEPYEPYTPQRARAEEFGDVLAEGWATRAESGPGFWAATPAFWRAAFAERKRMRADLQERVEASEHQQSRQMLTALAAAAWVQRALTPDRARQFAAYGATWRADLDDWVGRMENAEQLAPQAVLALEGEGREVQGLTVVAGRGDADRDLGAVLDRRRVPADAIAEPVRAAPRQAVRTWSEALAALVAG